MAKLVLILDDVAINEFPLKKSRTILGRGSKCDILVDDPIVSSQHAILISNRNAYMPGLLDVQLKDINSTNGTCVNERKVTTCKLKHGDMIQIGRSKFRFDDGHTDISSTTAIYIREDDKNAD
jgi:pSer/pThr/pTyr-binding forkhead associated (FHA) protein